MDLARVAAAAADDKLASDVVAIDVSEYLALTDIFVLATGSNERQIGAIVDEVEDKMREAGFKPARREGAREGRWALLDYVDLVVHILHADEREAYGDRAGKLAKISEPFVAFGVAHASLPFPKYLDPNQVKARSIEYGPR